ncbi:Orf151 [Heliothis zea nudivirus]|uniref:Uncharacterized protein n=2 Tax=Betanudivirus hezeae TaxID=3052000 RepID=G9I029_HZNV2|nr:Orf151 [Heliothis zea nudivirus]YP_004956751.1 orf3 gene product [Helicoverpa zea nudivirus 2]AAN04443.1 Orf151 [Heliothis zea nudivirus]AEW69552.1 hypothetical protein Hz2V003 [Helicoverpa zea nudivirus 2]WCZ68484.1 hypothetical protein HvNV003 [Heliothis virescens nudivirus]
MLLVKRSVHPLYVMSNLVLLNRPVSVENGAINANELAEVLGFDRHLMVEHVDDAYQNLKDDETDTLYITRTGFLQILAAMHHTTKHSDLARRLTESKEVLSWMGFTRKQMECTLNVHKINYRSRLTFGAMARFCRLVNQGFAYAYLCYPKDLCLFDSPERRIIDKPIKYSVPKEDDALIMIDNLKVAVFLQPFTQLELQEYRAIAEAKGYTLMTLTIRGPAKLLGVLIYKLLNV